jgi:hypothetical protein
MRWEFAEKCPITGDVLFVPLAKPAQSSLRNLQTKYSRGQLFFSKRINKKSYLYKNKYI